MLTYSTVSTVSTWVLQLVANGARLRHSQLPIWDLQTQVRVDAVEAGGVAHAGHAVGLLQQAVKQDASRVIGGQTLPRAHEHLRSRCRAAFKDMKYGLGLEG